LRSDQQNPAALKAAASNPASLSDGKSKPAAFKHGSLMLTPSASSTALIAGSLFIFNNSPVRATADAMWSKEEEAPPALAA
jgi:hypothetical protein